LLASRDSSTFGSGCPYGHHALSKEEAQAVNNEPLGIHFHSVIVKRSAVARSYQGGLEEFDRVHPSRKNDELSAFSAMSLDDVDGRLDQLFAAGLVPGVDVAVAEMHHGPILTCPGTAFRSDDALFFPSWTVEAVEAPDGAVGSWVGREAYTPDNAFGYYWQPPDAGGGSQGSPTEEPQALPASEPNAGPQLPGDPVRTGPRRVVFGSGPVHWLYDDDQEDAE
jgi:hypothetical protein